MRLFIFLCSIFVFGCFETNPPVPERFAITVTVPTEGSGTAWTDTDNAAEGETVTIHLEPEANFRLLLDSVSVRDRNGSAVKTKYSGETKTFVMPASDVSVTVNFMPISPLITHRVQVQPIVFVNNADSFDGTVGFDIEESAIISIWEKQDILIEILPPVAFVAPELVTMGMQELVDFFGTSTGFGRHDNPLVVNWWIPADFESDIPSAGNCMIEPNGTVKTGMVIPKQRYFLDAFSFFLGLHLGMPKVDENLNIVADYSHTNPTTGSPYRSGPNINDGQGIYLRTTPKRVQVIE
jgi:hypothetical protein